MASKTSAKRSAKSPKKAKKASKSSVLPPSSDTIRNMTINAAILNGLAAEFDKRKDRSASEIGALGGFIKDLVDVKGLDAIAWGAVNKFRRMALRDPLTARIRRENFDLYWDMLGISDMFASNMFAEPAKPKKKKATAQAELNPFLEVANEPERELTNEDFGLNRDDVVH